MRKIILTWVILAVTAFSQSYVFFNDSPDPRFYDPSWGFYSGSSQLELVNQNKFPVDTSKIYMGSNSLRLKWKSVSGGDWGLAVAENGWPGHNINTKDSLIFWAYSSEALSGTILPLLYLEDLNNNKSTKQLLSAFVSGIPANKWVKISFPLSVFKSNPGSADLTKIKTIFFGQSTQSIDGLQHTLLIDEIRMVNSDAQAPQPPQGITAFGKYKHIDIKWNANTESDLAGYKIYRKNGQEDVYIGATSKDETFFSDFVGATGITNTYTVTAFDDNMNESVVGNYTQGTTVLLSDENLLTMLQESTFRYFWDYAHPVSGLIRERLNSGETVTIGGSGFGVMALLVGIERGFVSREQGRDRMLKIAKFLSTKAQRFHGVWPHWLNGTTGAVIPFSTYDNGGDIVETAFMVQGLLAARQYFDQSNVKEDSIRTIITNLWETVEWDWYRRNNGNFIYWHWSPNYGWQMNMAISGWMEAQIVYLLAIASPTHSVPASLYYNGWTSSSSYANGRTFFNYKLFVGQDYGGPLFFAHYSYLGFDPRYKKDNFANYFTQNRNHTLIQKAYCTANPKGFAGYNENIWGLTASDNPTGYGAQAPYGADNGTITPTAALSSMPYTPNESIAAFKSMYNTYGSKIWGAYGFRDAFNVSSNWYAKSYLAIDQGPIIVMVENYRSGLLWKNFMKNPEITGMLNSIGFQPDSATAVEENSVPPVEFQLAQNYPNPFNPSTIIECTIPSVSGTSEPWAELKVFDVLGREVRTIHEGFLTPGSHKFTFNASSSAIRLPSGVYLYKLEVFRDKGSSAKVFSKINKMMLLK